MAAEAQNADQMAAQSRHDSSIDDAGPAPRSGGAYVCGPHACHQSRELSTCDPCACETGLKSPGQPVRLSLLPESQSVMTHTGVLGTGA